MMSDPSGDTTGYVLIFAICLFVVVVYKDRKLLYEEYFEDYPQGQRQHGSSFDFWRSKSVLDRFNPKAQELLADVGLSEFANIPAVEMPYGRKRALEIATTLALDPEMMLLDEPMAGMGHEDIDKIAGLIKRISAKYTILMVEHNLNVVANLSDIITLKKQA